MTKTQERVFFVGAFIPALIALWISGGDTGDLCADVQTYIQSSSNPQGVYQGLGPSYQSTLTQICEYSGP